MYSYGGGYPPQQGGYPPQQYGGYNQGPPVRAPTSPAPEQDKIFYRCIVFRALKLEEVEDSMNAEKWGFSIDG